MATQIDVTLRLIDMMTSPLVRVQNEMERTARAHQRMGRDIQRIGDGFSSVGESMLPIAAGITAIGAAGGRAFIDFDSIITGAAAKAGATAEEITTAAKRIYDKLQVVNSEYLKWFEILLACAFAILGYMAQIWILMFQAKMRQLEMEDEVMQFQTIILMLMRIERVNVEIILEWLERYSNIFKSQITRCVNDYEAGAWEALENLKNDISYLPMIRIVESMQAAVEKIPIKDAFDELDSEREYYREKRKESNDRLIKRKGMIGKVIGFAPMVCMFVGYLIIPLVFIGLTSMSSTFSSMSATTY